MRTLRDALEVGLGRGPVRLGEERPGGRSGSVRVMERAIRLRVPHSVRCSPSRWRTSTGASGAFFEPRPEATALLGVWILSWAVVGYAILPHVTIEPARWIMRAITDMSTDEFVAAVTGIILGLLMGFLLGLPLTNLPVAGRTGCCPSASRSCSAFGHDGSHGRQAGRPAQGAARPGHPDAAAHDGDGATSSGPVTYVDTSAIIDGRIVDVVASGFISGTLVVPRFVLGELQHIADDSQPVAQEPRATWARRALGAPEGPSRRPRAERRGRAGDLEAVDAKLVGLALRRGAGS